MASVVNILGLVFSVLAAVMLSYDLVNWLLTGEFVATDVGTVWHAVHKESLALANPAIERHLHPFLWDPVLLTILLAPAFIIFCAPGAILLGFRIFRRRSSKYHLFMR
tara:strand:- start:393 stop:716 length:324 start_codon:yes stop_codon:yes gene_type:complete